MLSSPLVLDLLKSSLAPALVVALFFFCVGGMKDPLRLRLQSLGWALGFVVGAYVLNGRLSFPPQDVGEAFSWVALLLAGFVVLNLRSLGTRYLVRALCVIAIGLLTVWQIRSSLHTYMNLRNLLAFFFLGLGVWSIVERTARTIQTLSLLVLAMISGTALSLLLLFKSSASMAQTVGVVCALLGGVAAVTLVAPQRVSKAALMPFASVFIICFMACGHFYLEINPWTMIYLCLPFFVLWVREWIPLVPRQPVGEAIVLGLISALPLGYMLWNIYQTSGPLF